MYTKHVLFKVDDIPFRIVILISLIGNKSLQYHVPVEVVACAISTSNSFFGIRSHATWIMGLVDITLDIASVDL